jgi:hypothetical protein
VIHFTRDQLFWHCREDEWTGDDVYGLILRYASDQAGLLLDRAECDEYWREKSPNSMEAVFFDPQCSVKFRYDCVSEFSTRSLTHASDKLAAIAGLASKFCQTELGKYLAGLWEKYLFRGMTWKTVDPAKRAEAGYQSYIAAKAEINLSTGSLEPPLEYRAPSWSWASVNCAVEWGLALWTGKSFEYWQKKYGPYLVSYHLLHSSDNAYIDILEGSFVEVRGYYRKIWVSNVKLFAEADGPKGPFIRDMILDKIHLRRVMLIYANQISLIKSGRRW